MRASITRQAPVGMDLRPTFVTQPYSATEIDGWPRRDGCLVCLVARRAVWGCPRKSQRLSCDPTGYSRCPVADGAVAGTGGLALFFLRLWPKRHSLAFLIFDKMESGMRSGGEHETCGRAHCFLWGSTVAHSDASLADPGLRAVHSAHRRGNLMRRASR